MDKNLQFALELAEKEIYDSVEFMKEVRGIKQPKNYNEFIEFVYDGDSKQFKDDLEYTFRELEFTTDDLEIIHQDGNITTYRKFINLLKKRVWK